MSRIPEEMLSELVQLQQLATKTRGTTPLGHEYRQAGDLLADLATSAMDEYGVTVHRLSLDMGLSAATMRLFLMRRGAIQITPGVENNVGHYKNECYVGKTKDACKRGHDYSEEQARDKYGACRKCAAIRARERYHRTFDPAARRAKYLRKKNAA